MQEDVSTPGRTERRGMALAALIMALVNPDPSGVPAELHDSASAPPEEETLERLRMNMDSSQVQ